MHVYFYWLDVVSRGQTLLGRVWPCETRLDECWICCEVLLPAAPIIISLYVQFCSTRPTHSPPSTVVGKVGIWLIRMSITACLYRPYAVDVISPYQFDLLIHEYGDSIFSKNDL